MIECKIDGHVAVITLNNPSANTFTAEGLLEFTALIADLNRNLDVYAAVVTGQGEKFFSAGAEISMLNAVTPTFKYYFCLHANETLSRLEQTPKLVIAALNGHTVGGGLEIALACDIRIAKKEGGKIGLPEVNLGVLPGTGGTQRFARAIGRSRALELMATGRTFSFEEALEMGLINYLYEKDSFWDDVLAYARQFCPPNKASRAVGRIKRSVVTGSEIPFAEALGLERELQQLLFTSEDAKEGLAAYVEKRAANFKGK